MRDPGMPDSPYRKLSGLFGTAFRVTLETPLFQQPVNNHFSFVILSAAKDLFPIPNYFPKNTQQIKIIQETINEI
jgi:hypothetical protein